MGTVVNEVTKFGGIPINAGDNLSAGEFRIENFSLLACELSSMSSVWGDILGLVRMITF